MDENTIRLLDLFGAYQPEEEMKARLDDVKVFDAEIDMKSRQVTVTVHLEDYLPLHMVRKIEQGIAGVYSIRKMELKTVYDPEMLSILRCSDIGEFLSELFAPSMSILAGCKYCLNGDVVTIELKGGGKEMLAPYLSRVEKWLSDMFCTTVKLCVRIWKRWGCGNTIRSDGENQDESHRRFGTVICTCAGKTQSGGPSVKCDFWQTI